MMTPTPITSKVAKKKSNPFYLGGIKKVIDMKRIIGFVLLALIVIGYIGVLSVRFGLLRTLFAAGAAIGIAGIVLLCVYLITWDEK